jgi:hypothetical protein
MVIWVLLSAFGVLAISERGEHDLTGLRIEVTVDPNHAQHRGRHLEVTLLTQMVGILQPLAPIELLAPMGHGVVELRCGEALRGFDQYSLRPLKLGRVRLASGHEHLHGGGGELAGAEGFPGMRHPLQGPGRSDVFGCRRPSQPVPVDEP